METHNTNKLIKILLRKGIVFERGDKQLFKSYDYYQVINAYKNLFVSSIEGIRDIFLNIQNNREIDRYKMNFNITRSMNNSDLFKDIFTN